PDALLSVLALGAVNRLDALLADQKLITRDKTELTLSLPLPREVLVTASNLASLVVVAIIPAVQKLRESAGRMQSANNLKQIALAMHNYHDANGHFPQDIVDKDGKPLLSWRVALLPYIEQDNLYKQFKLDEPWDSENNKKFSQTLVKVFMSPNATPPEKQPEYGWTHYRGISGPGAVFDPKAKVRIVDITDGTSNTIMVIETDEMVPWAKPGDYPFDPKKPLPKIVPPGGKDVFNAAFADGSVKAIKKTIDEKVLKALFTRAGGEVVDIDKENK
ncbi:MAG: DUF1559 domain-containing protein, partial [Gemmataceae bacterium]|nr:DUF1559 domain-containing protein [Gemmataceae bacterium]